MTVIKEIVYPYLTSTGIYDLPHDWLVTDIDSVITNIQSGFASGERDPNGVVQMRMNNITSDGQLNFEELLKVPKPPDLAEYDIKKDDILFNNTNSLDLIGKTAIARDDLEYTFSNHITRIRVDKNKVIPYWLYLILLRYRERSVFKSICNTHVGQSGIGKHELKRLRIWLPSIPEQQKITLILSKVDDLIQKTDEIIEQTQRLKKGLMQRLLTKGIGHQEFKPIKFLFGKKFEMPMEWNVAKLINLCKEKPQYGAAVAAVKYDPSLPRYIRITDITNEGSLNSEAVSITEEDANGYLMSEGEILFARTGATVGKTYLYNKEDGLCAFAGYLIKFTPDETKLDAKFLFHYTHSDNYWRWLLSNFTQGVQPNVNAEQYSHLPLLMPPIEEQRKIADILDTITAKVKQELNHKSQLELLKKGLMQKLLTGQIRVKV
ncbi:restriction endonuclease subunit S [Nitrososphaera viennensis]|uniref:Restriction endonuclease subunit S n=2 Tax=Nitrososphaera viennensis TaxID=1034015 RepID=A0A977ICT8_9ARCH|nr:restriction endonuclease subunit S [Nitrososphaera viennensis]AIC16479.1 putative Type I restriction-modification system, specificity subunit S [Nitrososphaera viennensis EN76]UVS68412.1 restriction endonuclease subunit S [Nitrososphaera viennensis]